MPRFLLILLLLLITTLHATAGTTSYDSAYQQFSQHLQDVRRQHEQLRSNEAELHEQLQALEGSPLLYRVLQQQRLSLPQIENDPFLPDVIAQIRLQQFEVNQALRQARREHRQEPQLEADQQRLQLLLNLLVELQQEQRELLNTSNRLNQVLDERLFWVNSSPPVNSQWFLLLPQRLTQQFQSFSTGALLPTPEQLSSSFWRTLLLMLLAVVLWWLRQHIERHLATCNQQLEGFQAAHQACNLEGNCAPPPPAPWLTPVSLLLTGLLCLPRPLLLLSAASLLSNPDSDLINPAAGLAALALSGFMLLFMHRVLTSARIAELHFAWPETTRQRLLSFVRHLAWVLLPASFILALAEQQTLSLPADVLGVLVLLCSGLALCWLFARLMWQTPPLYNSLLLHWTITGLLILMPLLLVVITAMGYYFAGLKLTSRLLISLYVVVGWVVTETSVYRMILLATERIRHQREQEHQLLVVEASGEELADVKPLPRLEVEQIYQQSMRLARFLLLLGFGGLLWWVWSDLLTAFRYLDTLVLWQYSSGDSLQPISLADFLAATFILGFALFLAANLPGLLEILVLSRLQLQQGSAYAITTLLNYAITATGLVMMLSALGVSWDKLQWLVAALTVGLGFGLQEIFANFVSGLILLFERPVRIGDVVTLGNLSGRVRQIRIRATTITDFDRKDIIVPNKNFITGQLINWSLTDTVTRVIVKVGVAYGSDLDKTREILLAAAEANPRVLEDPKPQVLFLNFGDSTLDHELRIHVKELSDRNPSIDEINRYIDQRFREEGIEIAFRQLDIHLRNSEGVEKLVQTRMG
ncbi:mechanosensitive ion channel domain-containing protein [Marinospirillum alkaliphilum]|uniref:Potassium efflux system protein n=1 Tax=Marinospirillum alkaliphilum DSM 21637 TaxID=1122209 RepID=A0A1K1Y2M0_9GAMM|nr:mechanosensitive ion channel domain-containing protein [Marinospirillum alkaliphilum]SFX56218.1 potassium efflux system protein [Marinospirillum alkaliphilum DSM 21637]